MDYGTLAEWVSAILSGIAIIIAVWQSSNQNRIKHSFSAALRNTDSKGRNIELVLTIVNDNDYHTTPQALGIIIFDKIIPFIKIPYKKINSLGLDISKENMLLSPRSSKTISVSNNTSFQKVVGKTEGSIYIKIYAVDASGRYIQSKKNYKVFLPHLS